jgi:NADH-quinone oxidoreductase subunit F
MGFDRDCNYIFICEHKDCLKRGAVELRKSIKKQLKDQGLKKHFKVVKTSCMDACKHGPNLVLEGKIHYQCSLEQALNLIQESLQTH